jgi:hypothetical protein
MEIYVILKQVSMVTHLIPTNHLQNLKGHHAKMTLGNDFVDTIQSDSVEFKDDKPLVVIPFKLKASDGSVVAMTNTNARGKHIFHHV